MVYFLYQMDFEFDKRKSANNKKKHGIDFLEAQALWKDTERIEIPARTEDEPRHIVIGKINRKHWSSVITYRGDKTRIISVRRAQKTEIKIYES